MPVIAIGAIDLVAFILGLMAILVMFAFYVPVKLLGLMLRNVPIIGSFLNNTLATSLMAAMHTVSGQLDDWANGVTGLLASLGGGLHWLFFKTLQVVTHLSFLIQAVEGHAQHAQSTADNAQTAANNAIAQATAAAEANAAGLIAQANAQAAANLAAVQQGLSSQILAEDQAQTAALEADQAAAASQLQSVAAGLGAQIGAVQSDVQSVASELFGTIAPEIAALQQEVAGLSIPNLGSIEDVINSDITKALEAAGVASIAGLLTQVGALTTEVTECLEPLCDTVTPNAGRLGNLGNLFANMELLGVEALIIALAAECLTDPAAVAHDITAVMQDVGTPIMDGFKELIGA